MWFDRAKHDLEMNARRPGLERQERPGSVLQLVIAVERGDCRDLETAILAARRRPEATVEAAWALTELDRLRSSGGCAAG